MPAQRAANLDPVEALRYEAARVCSSSGGGLGSPLALALAAAPEVASLTLLRSRCRRDLEPASPDPAVRRGPGPAKVEAAAAMLRRRGPRGIASPTLSLRPLQARLHPENSRQLFAQHDLIIDGSDDLATKFLVSDTACATARPALIGALFASPVSYRR